MTSILARIIVLAGLFLPIIFGSGKLLDSSKYFPLIPGSWWEFEGKVLATGEIFKTKIVVDPKETICGFEATPLAFFKNSRAGYWAPEANVNMRWLLVDFGKGRGWPREFIWGLGHKQYDRQANGDSGDFQLFISYLSKDNTLPAYVILPRWLKPGSSYFLNQEYYQTSGEDKQDCRWMGPNLKIGEASWRVSYDIEEVAAHIYKGKAIRAHFVENLDGRAWIEDWYFAEGIGPVKIDVFAQGEKLKKGRIGIKQSLLLEKFVIPQ